MKLFGYTMYGFAVGLLAAHFFGITKGGPDGNVFFLVPVPFLVVGVIVELIQFVHCTDHHREDR